MNNQDKNIVEFTIELQELKQEHNSLKVSYEKDITENKLAKDQLQLQRMNLDAVFESSPVPVFVIDDTTNIVMTNLAFTVMCRGSESDIMQPFLRCKTQLVPLYRNAFFCQSWLFFKVIAKVNILF